MRPVGDHALLLELGSSARVLAAARAARELYGDQLQEVVPGHETLLLAWPDGGVIPDISELALVRASSEMSEDDATHPEPTVVPVRYDGADLSDISSKLGVSPEAVIAQHTEARYVVAFTGFSPGFPYLVAEPASVAAVAALLELPRLETPRTEVPAGSVAVAAGYCGIYPRSSPGGWNLLGRTEVVLFDVQRQPPAMLAPGVHVRFEPI